MDLINLMNSLTITEPQVEKESNINVTAAEINGVHTDIVYAVFTNKYLILATQYEKAGSLLNVSVEYAQNGLEVVQPIYNITNIFGPESIEQHAAVRYIAEKLNIRKPLKIFLCLKNYECKTVTGLVEALLNIPLKENNINE